MYGFGDMEQPLPETVEVMDDIVCEFISRLVRAPSDELSLCSTFFLTTCACADRTSSCPVGEARKEGKTCKDPFPAPLSLSKNMRMRCAFVYLPSSKERKRGVTGLGFRGVHPYQHHAWESGDRRRALPGPKAPQDVLPSERAHSGALFTPRFPSFRS